MGRASRAGRGRYARLVLLALLGVALFATLVLVGAQLVWMGLVGLT